MADTEQDELKPNGFRLTPEQLSALMDKWSKPEHQEQALESAEPLKVDELEQPQVIVKDDLIRQRILRILDQRNKQRRKIFNLAKHYCWTSLIFLIIIVSVQIIYRVVNPGSDFKIFDGNELQIIVAGVFGQFVGLLYIITKSLYDDTNYKDLFKDSVGK